MDFTPIILKSEIQQLLVNRVYPDGEDHLLVDEAILAAAAIQDNEKIVVCNHANGERFETYALRAGKGSQACYICGPASRLVNTGDTVNITSYGRWPDGQAPDNYPLIIAPLNDSCSNSIKSKHHDTIRK